MGEDDFVVPKSFDEFDKRYPKYVLDWAKKRLNRFTVDEDVEDDAQDLWIYLRLHEVNAKLESCNCPFCAMPRILSVAMVGLRGGSSRARAFR